MSDFIRSASNDDAVCTVDLRGNARNDRIHSVVKRCVLRGNQVRQIFQRLFRQTLQEEIRTSLFLVFLSSSYRLCIDIDHSWLTFVDDCGIFWQDFIGNQDATRPNCASIAKNNIAAETSWKRDQSEAFFLSSLERNVLPRCSTRL